MIYCEIIFINFSDIKIKIRAVKASSTYCIFTKKILATEQLSVLTQY
jgi:hypothetical protein